MKPISYARHRFPPEVIRHAVWLYLRFTLSYRDVEDLLAERGLTVSNESIRRWVLKFGPVIAKNLRGTRPKPHNRWHLDEMVVSIAGRQLFMWRAVDSEGEVLEILVQPHRDKAAAVLDQETASTSGLRSCGNHHRQTKILRSGTSRNCVLGFARARTARQQSRGEFASAASTTRTKDARLQINQISSALCFRPRGRLQHVQRATTFDQPADPETISDRSA
jgi:transposase-like protein